MKGGTKEKATQKNLDRGSFSAGHTYSAKS